MESAGARSDNNDGFSPLLHDRSRLTMTTLLATIAGAEMSFIELPKRSGLTGGNFSAHVEKLERVGYVTVTKSFRGQRPCTTVATTESGKKALEEHIEQMERIVEQFRAAAGDKTVR
ncbi:MAG: transcriptional regulator [Spirochaetaceae bacterium]|nr:MAG: transcriptional regulator [Spirochaetaceae bacterium]